MNMGLSKRILYAILFVLYNLVASAQTNFCNEEGHYTINDGLSNNQVTSILQDSLGFLWIGTLDGLNRYDGYHFKIFRNQYLSDHSISNNQIHDLCKDSNNNVWIATRNGLNQYQFIHNEFINYLHDEKDTNSISNNIIFEICFTGNNQLILLTNSGIDVFHIQSGQLKRVFHKMVTNQESNTDYRDYHILSFESSKKIIIDMAGIFFLLNLDNNTCENITSARTNKRKEVLMIEPNKNHSFLQVDDTAALAIKKELQDASFQSISMNGNIHVIYNYSKNKHWLGTSKGLAEYDKRNSNPLSMNADLNHDLMTLDNPPEVNAIFEDLSKIIWIGTSHGLIKHDKKGKKFKQYSYTAEDKPLFSNNMVGSIFLLNDSLLFVGTWGSGLHVYNRNNGKIKQYHSTNHQLVNDFINVLHDGSGNKLWIGTRNGVNIYNTVTGEIADFADIIPQSQSLFNNNRVFTILEDSGDNIWFGTYKGLHKYHKDQLTSYYAHQEDAFLPSNTVFKIIEDNRNNLWIGTDKGLVQYDPVTKNRVHYKNRAKDRKRKLSSSSVYSILEASDNTLWVGTLTGLNHIYPETGKVDIYTESVGLPNNMIYGILEDNHQNLWMSTNKGIVRFNPGEKEFISYDVYDGLQSYKYNAGAYYKSKDGEMFFGGINGLNSFYPDSVLRNNYLPKIAITSFTAYTPNGPKEININNANGITIPYDNNYFKIEFAALDFSRPEKNQFQYMLEGVSDNWIHVGNNHSATFSNIPPGNYVFKVKGSNNDGVWSDKISDISIDIQAPFWQKRIAYVFYGILILAIIFIIFQIRTKNLRKLNRILKEKELAGIELGNQREQLMHKNKSITDSIHYAKRIQEALLPSEKYFKSLLPSSFILYMPKDIVSGDFYWINQTDDKIFLAVVDCTGHGVPGAFMSIIGFELLGNITTIEKIMDASEILNRLNKGVSETFGIDNDEYDLKDGMDLSLCVIDKKNKTLEYAGAFNPLYVIKDNKIIEYKADRYTIGMLNDPDESFTKHAIPLEEVEMIYMFTDGYTDQFGGPEEKKFKFRRFRHLLLTIHKLSLNKQKLFLQESLEKWKRDLEQVDDILVIGINPQELMDTK